MDERMLTIIKAVALGPVNEETLNLTVSFAMPTMKA
jgi:hypothetical protein